MESWRKAGTSGTPVALMKYQELQHPEWWIASIVLTCLGGLCVLTACGCTVWAQDQNIWSKPIEMKVPSKTSWKDPMEIKTVQVARNRKLVLAGVCACGVLFCIGWGIAVGVLGTVLKPCPNNFFVNDTSIEYVQCPGSHALALATSVSFCFGIRRQRQPLRWPWLLWQLLF